MRESNTSAIGKTYEVLYEDVDYDRGLFRGRTQFDAPDIDRNVYFKADFVEAGNFYKVKITGFDD